MAAPSAAPLVRRALVAELVILFGALVVAVVTNGATYDRYLWPAVLAAAILLLDRYPPPPLEHWHPAASQVALVVASAFAIVSLLVTLNSDAFDGARWRLDTQVAGVPATAVDGGFEWVGAHATSVDDANASSDATRSYWVAMAGEPAPCVEVSASPVDRADLVLVRTVTWRTWLLFGRSRLYEYRRPSACG